MIRSYQNMKLKGKLLLGFALVALIGVIIGLVGILGVNNVSQVNTEMYEDNTRPMGDLAAMYDTLASQRICAANMVMFHTHNPEFAAEEADALTEKEELFEDAFAEYKLAVNTDQEQTLYDAISSMYSKEFADAKAGLRAAVASGDATAMADAMKTIDDVGAEVSGFMDEAFALNVSDAEAKEADGNKVASQSSIFLLVAIGVGLAMAALCAFYIANLITKPIAHIMACTKQVGETGNLHFSDEIVATIKHDASFKDEVGQTAASFAAMMDDLIAKSAVLEQVAEGDLTVTVQKASNEDTLGNAVELMVKQLSEMFGEINMATEQVNTGSEQIATGAQTLAQATTEQSATVEELLASVGNVAAQTRENAERAEHAAALAGNIKTNAEQGTTQMTRMTQAVEEINSASQAISAVIKVIDDIAFQTNILALNAAVEAARAGEHGKGFAVVADEVRNLAGKSAEAAKDTGSLIADTVEKAELGAQIARQTSESLDTIVEGINESTAVVSEIAASSEQQSLAIEEINNGIDQVSHVVQQNSATSEESAAAAEEMSSQATMLKNMVARFKVNANQPALSAPSYSASPAPQLPPQNSGDYIF